MEGLTRKRLPVVGGTERKIGNISSQLKFVNQRTGLVRRRRMGKLFAGQFPIASPTGFFLSDRRVSSDRRLQHLEELRYFKPP
jgi:hypothetical protein